MTRNDPGHETPLLPFNGKPRGRNGGRRSRLPRAKRPVRHAVRDRINRSTPAHVCCRVGRGLPSLRGVRTFPVVLGALRAARERFGFRLLQFSVQHDHLHLIVEADSPRALARGMKGLSVRLARRLNRL